MEQFDLRKWDGFKKAGGSSDVPLIIDHVAIDSRRIASKNTLFIALTGVHFDGHTFLKQAYKAGARLALVRTTTPADLLPEGMQLLKVEDPLRALQQIAGAFRREMNAKVIAVTGSYGKTMLKDLLKHLIAEELP
ncbi:MAG: alr, partial [Chlamydiia bacterium]|nr:alr [Chlamydiia bacterium]